MTDSFVTQCPHCQTSFRVGHSQLAIARGVVRCGACLQVFNAAQQLLDEQAARAKPPKPVEVADLEPDEPEPSLDFPPFPEALPERRHPPEPLPAQEPEIAPPAKVIKTAPQTLWIHDDLDLDSLDLDEELAKLEEQELELNRQLLARQRPLEARLAASRDHVEDESWAEALLNDDADERVKPMPAVEAQETENIPPRAPQEPTLQEPTLKGPFIHHPEDRRRAPLTEEPPLDERTEPSMSFDETFHDDDEFDAPRHVTEADARNTGRHRETSEPFTEHEALAAERFDNEPDEAPEAQDLHGRNEPGVRDESLFNLYDDPLQLDWQERHNPWGKRILWSLLVLAATGGLFAQYVAYHFEELSRQDEYRPWFQEFCPAIGCTLPSKVDIALIRSSNLVVRSHPDFAGALVVDAILYNRASFSQPFPLLELRFADGTGHLIASRRFKPGEYLSGEMAGQDEMPPQTPIHISLDILDPGPKAVNYSLSFHSPE